VSIGKRIYELRKSRKYSMAKLAEEIGCTHTAINDWEKEKNYPKTTHVFKLSKSLKVTPEYLLTGNETVNATFFKYPIYKDFDSIGKKTENYITDSIKHPNGSFWWIVSDNVMNGKYSQYHNFKPDSLIFIHPLNDTLKNRDYVLVKDAENNVSIRHYLAESGVKLLLTGNTIFENLSKNLDDYKILGIIKQHKIAF